MPPNRAARRRAVVRPSQCLSASTRWGSSWAEPSHSWKSALALDLSHADSQTEPRFPHDDCEGAGMTRDDAKAFFDRRQHAWRGRDVQTLTAGHADDGVIASPMFGTIRGRAAIEKSYHDLFAVFQDWEFEGEDLLIDGTRAAQPFTVRATQSSEFFGVPASGRRFETHGVMIYQFERGLIQHERRIYDFTALLIQIGVLKAKPK